MDVRGCVFDNIFIERLWRSVKYEDIYLNVYYTVPNLISWTKPLFLVLQPCKTASVAGLSHSGPVTFRTAVTRSEITLDHTICGPYFGNKFGSTLDYTIYGPHFEGKFSFQMINLLLLFT